MRFNTAGPLRARRAICYHLLTHARALTGGRRSRVVTQTYGDGAPVAFGYVCWGSGGVTLLENGQLRGDLAHRLGERDPFTT